MIDLFHMTLTSVCIRWLVNMTWHDMTCCLCLCKCTTPLRIIHRGCALIWAGITALWTEREIIAVVAAGEWSHTEPLLAVTKWLDFPNFGQLVRSGGTTKGSSRQQPFTGLKMIFSHWWPSTGPPPCDIWSSTGHTKTPRPQLDSAWQVTHISAMSTKNSPCEGLSVELSVLMGWVFRLQLKQLPLWLNAKS